MDSIKIALSRIIRVLVMILVKHSKQKIGFEFETQQTKDHIAWQINYTRMQQSVRTGVTGVKNRYVSLQFDLDF